MVLERHLLPTGGCVSPQPAHHHGRRLSGQGDQDTCTRQGWAQAAAELGRGGSSHVRPWVPGCTHKTGATSRLIPVI